MSQHKHTPGEWKVDKGETDELVIREPGGEVVAVVCSIANEDRTEEEANADLIASAPDLLKACEALFDALSRIVEFSLTEDREGNLYNENGESVISRDQRAHALLSIRKSFKALVKAKGEP